MELNAILNEIAALSPETREFLGVDERGNRVAQTILHPTPTDAAVWEKMRELTPLISRVQAGTLANALEMSSQDVSKSLKYFLDTNLVTKEGVRGSTTYSIRDMDAELPTVEAKPRGRKPGTKTATPEDDAAPEQEQAEAAPKKAPGKRKKAPKKSEAA